MIEGLKILKRIRWIIVTLYLFFSISGILFYSKKLPWVIGLTLSLIVSILLFIQLSKSVENIMYMPKTKAQRYFVSRYMFRFIIYLILVVASIRSENLDTIAVFFGLMIIKFSIQIDSIISRKER